MDLDRLQDEVAAWTRRNFGDQPTHRQVLGVCEEAGELAHATLKAEQGIRGGTEEHEAAARDAVGDIVIYLADLCARKGWSLQACIEETWARVSARDWRSDPEHGSHTDAIEDDPQGRRP